MQLQLPPTCLSCALSMALSLTCSHIPVHCGVGVTTSPSLLSPREVEASPRAHLHAAALGAEQPVLSIQEAAAVSDLGRCGAILLKLSEHAGIPT